MNFFEKITNNLKKKDFALVRLIILISAAALAVLFCLSQNSQTNIPFDIENSKEFRIIISKIDVNEIVYEGIDEEILNKGPGHFPGTALPEDKKGNVVISGHSAQTKEHDNPFARVDELEKGDLIQLTKDGNLYEYKVTQTEIVASTEMSVIKPTKKPTLTLITCIKPDYPRDKRLIIKAEKIVQ